VTIRLLQLVGSETGNSEIAADAVAGALTALGHQVSTILEGATPADLAGYDVVLISTSSHGQGDIPDNLLPFCRSLEQEAPDLHRLVYGLIVLGDSNYAETFGGAGKKVDALFARLGARSVTPRLLIDANEHPIPDPVAVAWAVDWVRRVEATACAEPAERASLQASGD